ncbi:MAG: hypothetical protein ABJP02_00085 [Parasphingorhabdus sp.]|uniref:hypothetical protein n=1 Tax=Alphaproteobacteria TaxID=28211 RepID=UPI003298D02C
MFKQSAMLVIGAAMLVSCGSGGNDFNDQFREGFIKSCEQASTAAGTPADVATKVCDCSADNVMENYSAVERAQLRGDKVDKILDQCMAETGSAQS